MWGVIIVAAGTFFEEIVDSIGKAKVQNKEQSPFTMAFLSVFWIMIFFAVTGLVKKGMFVFGAESILAFTLRVILENLLFYISVLGTVVTDRSTFSFIWVLSIPLLLTIDLFLDYQVPLTAKTGMAIIFLSLFLLFRSIGTEEFFIYIILLLSLILFVFKFAKENLLLFLKKLLFFFQSLAVRVGGFIESFAFGLGIASVITAAKHS